ncbi:hypothetical protein SAMN02910317_00495 [Ruminococcaceae bacterium FB2012]|nr:hypothetical protein SAMN02910317_00495 [Ruminococcaceae bacterium FB2012]
MGNVIRMDLYRLRRALSFKIGLIIVFVMNLAEGPLTKIIYDVSKKIAESAENSEEVLAELGEWNNSFHFGNIIAGQMGIICTAVFLLVIVKFCYADIQHGYIKNIAGQLPSRGHTIVSKFIAIQFAILVFYAATIIGNTAGQFIIGREIKFDMFFAGYDGYPDKVFSMGAAAGEFAIKWLLLSGLCALVLLLTTGIGSNIAGTIVAVLCGAGFTGLAYTGISAGINKLFNIKEFALSEFMPDSLYRTDLFNEDCVLTALAIAAVFIVVIMYLTTTLYNKRDIN